MGRILHGSATTTATVRRAIPHSQESLRTLAARYDINLKTVDKWRKRTSVEDAVMGPSRRSSILTVEQEAIFVAFRKHTLIPLDDYLYALQATIPQLTRSSLHRCFLRHGISGFRKSKGMPHHPKGRSSKPIPSAISTSTSPKSPPLRGSSIS